MDCGKARNCVFDLRDGKSIDWRTEAAKLRREERERCQSCLQFYDSFCHWTAQQLALPPNLDWEPLRRALTEEMERHRLRKRR